MKKLLLVAFMALFSMAYASAQTVQWTIYYPIEQEGQEYPDTYWFKIDWTNKYFFLDSDSEDETLCPMKNLKENGNKKTFDVYYTQSVGGGKYCSAEFVTNEDNSWTLTVIQTGEDGNIWKRTYKLSDKEPKKSGGDDNGGGIERKSPRDLVKGGVNKVTGVFKKK
ncbi:MAG: hypothetical protein IKV12_01070 [Alistipes sp.]|nr:hypothetical protein [Alistipes sp.]